MYECFIENKNIIRTLNRCKTKQKTKENPLSLIKILLVLTEKSVEKLDQHQDTQNTKR